MLPKILHRFVVTLYGTNRRFNQIIATQLCMKLDGGEFYSTCLRDIFLKHFGVKIGMYSHGGCFVKNNFSPFTTIGRFSSIAYTATAFNRNHPMSFKSTHAFFYNPKLKFCNQDPVVYNPIVIGNDVWIGHNAIITPVVQSVGDGSVIAAGAVVNKNVPPYAVVVGNPARIVRYRFDVDTIAKLIEEKWWDKSINELKDQINEFQQFTKCHIIQ
jgi:virginiamycin A acetyltransferase